MNEGVLSHLALYEKCRVEMMAWSRKLWRMRTKNTEKKIKSQNPPHLHHRPPFISMVSKCKVNKLPPFYKWRNWSREWQYDRGHPTNQWQSREEIPGFLSPNFIMYPLGSTALFLHQSHYKLLNQDCGDLYHLCTEKQGKQKNYTVERFSSEVILNSSGILCHCFQPWLW